MTYVLEGGKRIIYKITSPNSAEIVSDGAVI